VQPSSGVGANLLWKKAQKKAKKKQTSEIINRIIPHRNPFTTYLVCCPINVASRITSRHHWIIVNPITRRPKITPIKPSPWNQAVRPSVRVRAPIDPVRGQGLHSTK